MFMMISVASVCLLAFGIGLVRLACRHRKDLWIASEDAMLCFVSPALILLCTFCAVSLGWRFTHGGFAAVSVGGWIGSLAIVLASIAAWRLLAPRIRESGKTRANTPGEPSAPAPAPG